MATVRAAGRARDQRHAARSARPRYGQALCRAWRAPADPLLAVPERDRSARTHRPLRRRGDRQIVRRGSDAMPEDARKAPAAGAGSSSADEARRTRLWRVGRVVLGMLLIALGAVGCVLPVLPGIPLLIAGAALLGPRHWLIRPFSERLERWRKRER